MSLALLGLPVVVGSCVSPVTIQRAQQAELADPPDAVLATVADLQPATAAWYRAAERTGLAEGRPLNAAETQLALQVGVHDPARVRVVIGFGYPDPTDPELVEKAQTIFRSLPASPRSSTFGHAIYIAPRFAGQRWLLAHELTHVAQFERLGIDGFVHEYLLERLLFGYLRAPLERAAVNNEHLGK